MIPSPQYSRNQWELWPRCLEKLKLDHLPKMTVKRRCLDLTGYSRAWAFEVVWQVRKADFWCDLIYHDVGTGNGCYYSHQIQSGLKTRRISVRVCLRVRGTQRLKVPRPYSQGDRSLTAEVTGVPFIKPVAPHGLCNRGIALSGNQRNRCLTTYWSKEDKKR